ncbi:cytochrome P450 CYP736A12-like [Abrus precatorius]|uniref:Cytochrome P450 CYP736A12-like n=1 Tax=Abrus precatorius TaxID=3816 RepID=A0A8B8L6I6_ABRPR|nr:cytochrome P450 CYP736A12-like [Abrus precatorius]
MASAEATAAQILVVLTFTYLVYTLFLRPKQPSAHKKKPPGPPTLPIIGNLHLLGTLPHRTLHSLPLKYGPIMSLQLGQVPTVVVSSSETAELFLKTHDVVFASRPKLQSSEIISYGSKGMAFSEYGPYWRNMRKICTLQLLSASKVELFAPIRKEELCAAVKSLEKAAVLGEVVNISEVVENLVEDMVHKMVLGRSKYDHFDLKTLVQQGNAMVGAFNLADYVPWLRPFDYQGLTRGLKKISKGLDEVLEQIIKEHEQAIDVGRRDRKDFVDILLSTMDQTTDPHNEQNRVIDRTNIKAILLDMVVGAIETSTTVIQWALSALLRHPRVMKVLQDEIENEVGIKRMVEECDLMKLGYLDMVVDETLRLYPAAPFLVPRESRENITINGYYIKKNSRVIINAWAIGRDPNVWSSNAETFYPERFIDMKMNHQGDFRSIPFGSGRRGCPGVHLGLVTVRLVLAQLVHCFNWELPPNVSPANVNMQEKFGLNMPRAEQLLAIPTYRLATKNE